MGLFRVLAYGSAVAVVSIACQSEPPPAVGEDQALETRLADGDDECVDAIQVGFPWVEEITIEPGDRDWRSFDVPAGPDVVWVIETVPVDFNQFDDDPNLMLYAGDDCAGKQGLVFSEDRAGSYSAHMAVQLSPGHYYIEVGGWNDASYAHTYLTLRDPNPPPPKCDAQTAQTACSGGPCDCVCEGDECSCPATYADEAEFAARVPDLDARWCASILTLDAFQAAIDAADPGTTITKEAGYHDHSAVVYPLDDFNGGGFFNPTPPDVANEFYAYNVNTRHCRGDGDPDYCFGPHRLKGKTGQHQAAHGVVILGAQDLVIQGSGDHDTIILGNPHWLAAHQDGTDGPAWYNIALSAGGGSTDVTIQNLHFKTFWMSVAASSHFAHPTGPANINDPAYAGGTVNLSIANNKLTPTQWSTMAAGGHIGFEVVGNYYDMTETGGGGAIGGLWGSPGVPDDSGNPVPPELLVDARVVDNTIVFAEGEGGSGIMLTWGYNEGGLVEGNYQLHGETMVSITGSSGWTVRDNTADGATVGISLGAFYTYTNETGYFRQLPDDNLIEDNELHVGDIGIDISGGSGNTLDHNEIEAGGAGIRIGWERDFSGFFGFQGSEWNEITDHEIGGDLAYGMMFDGASYNSVDDVEIDGAGIGIALYGSSYNSGEDIEIKGATTCIEATADSIGNTFDVECEPGDDDDDDDDDDD